MGKTFERKESRSGGVFLGSALFDGATTFLPFKSLAHSEKKAVMASMLRDVQKALKDEVVMSEDLD